MCRKKKPQNRTLSNCVPICEYQERVSIESFGSQDMESGMGLTC